MRSSTRQNSSHVKWRSAPHAWSKSPDSDGQTSLKKSTTTRPVVHAIDLPIPRSLDSSWSSVSFPAVACSSRGSPERVFGVGNTLVKHHGDELCDL